MQNPLKTKLSAFKRKYFLHRFYRGALLFVVFGLGFWIIVSVLEYFFFLPTGFRAVLFFSLVLVELWVLVSYLLIPGYQLVRKDSVMSDEEAARLIGEFFPMIEDRLLNTLQLSGQGSNDPLLLASIQQRTNALKPFDFRKGIDFKKHYHLLFWALPVILVLAILWITGKQVILTSGTDRIVRFSEEFHPPNPFSIQILNNELEGISGQDILVKFEILGPYRPERVALSIEGMEIPVRKDGKAYSYLFKSVTRDVDFVILTNGFANG
ncbi:MAG: hypothetical protein LPK80_04010, partial [Bacteroidota bacterium]|nr:hypothetical protein [Bacteroidota bacterium]